MKKIKRTKDMPDWAKYVAMDKNGQIFCYDATDLYCNKKNYYIHQWGFSGKNGTKYRSISIKPYCKNWEKSLRKIVDKPKKSKLIKQQAKKIESLLDLIELKRKTIQNLLQVIGAYEDGEMK